MWWCRLQAKRRHATHETLRSTRCATIIMMKMMTFKVGLTRCRVVYMIIIRGRPKVKFLHSAETESRTEAECLPKVRWYFQPKRNRNRKWIIPGPKAVHCRKETRRYTKALSEPNSSNSSMRTRLLQPLPAVKARHRHLVLTPAVFDSLTYFRWTARTMPKPKVYRMWDDYFRPEPNVYRKCSFSHIRRRNRNRNRNSVDL